RNVPAAGRDPRRAETAGGGRRSGRTRTRRLARAVRERWFGATGRRVPEIAVEGELDLDDALVLDDVASSQDLHAAHEAGRPHVGAVATQAWANPRYGPDGLALLRSGKPAEEVVHTLTAADEGREHRQIGVVDAAGRAATFTGAECNEWAGGRTGECYAAQGNILVSGETVDA